MKDKIQLKIFILLPVLFMLFLDCSGQNLKITIFNTTGYDLDSIAIGDKYVGFIQKDSSVVIFDCKEIHMVGSYPFEPLRGIIKGKKQGNEVKFLCGTGVTEVYKGEFKYDITLNEGINGYNLFWRSHK